MSEASSTIEAAGVQLDDPVPLHSDNVTEGDDSRNGDYVEQI